MDNKIVLVIGSYADRGQPGIYLCGFDPADGNINLFDQLADIENPSYLCLSDKSGHIYAVSDLKEGEMGRVSVYRRPSDTQTFSRLVAERSYIGSGSCFVSTDQDERYLFIANYVAGSLTILPLEDGKTPGAPVKMIQFEGSGPNKERQEKPHIHCTVLSTDEQFLYCTDLGTDRLYKYHYDPYAKEILKPAIPGYISLPAGSGPRHIAFSPSKRFMYMVTEMTGQLFAFETDVTAQAWFQQISLVEEGYAGKIEGGDVQIHSSGKYLYASNRGDANELIVCVVNEPDGRLTLAQRISCEGESPRNLVIDPTGNFLLAANENSNSVTVFRIDLDTGQLTYTARNFEVNKPSCLKFMSYQDKQEQKRSKDESPSQKDTDHEFDKWSVSWP